MDFDKTLFLASMRQGMGFSRTCVNQGIDIQEMSAHLQENPYLMAEVQQQLQLAYKAILALSSQHLAARKLDKWKENNEYMRGFLGTINLWESYCTKDEVNPTVISEAFHIYREPLEVATVTGHTQQELYRYIYQNRSLKNYLLSLKMI